MKPLDSEVIIRLAFSYGHLGPIAYFAGGHEHSDAVIYSFFKGEKTYLLKIMEVKDKHAIDIHTERQEFAAYLAQKGIPTAKPIPSTGNLLCESQKANGKQYLSYCWQMIEGKPLADIHPKNLQDYYHKWASLIAKMHLAAREYPRWEGSKKTFPDGRYSLSWEREWESFYAWIPDSDVKNTWKELKEKLLQHPKNRDNFGFIHNDAHPQNILEQGSELVPIDFDVANYHWFILDIAIAIYSEYSRIGFHSKHKDTYPEMKKLFLEPFLAAYKGLITLPVSDWDNLELFIQYRRIVMFTVFYDQIKKGNAAYLEQFKQDIIAWKCFL